MPLHKWTEANIEAAEDVGVHGVVEEALRLLVRI